MTAFSEVFLSQSDIEAVLTIVVMTGANASELVEKIVINQKGFQKCSLCVKVYYKAKAYHYNNSKKIDF